MAVGRRRRVIAHLQVRRRSGLPNRETPLAGLFGLDGADARHLCSRLYRAEVVLGAPQRDVGLHVADDDERRVVRHVVAAVVPVQVVARHRLQIRQPSDRRMPVRVRLERGRRQFLIEQLIGIVVAALELGDDHGALRLAVVRMV